MRTAFSRLLLLVFGALALAACGGAPASNQSAASFKTMSVADLKGKLDTGASPFLLDVRTAQEFQQDGYVAQATLIPLNELGSRLGELPKDQPIACICRSGNRSAVACTDLAARGYNVTNVSGGMQAWVAAGFPVAQQ